MSLFDIIKYPISDQPTKAELDALPFNLLTEWNILCSRYDRLTPEALVRYYKILYRIDERRPDIIDEVNILRKMIKEYEPV